MVPAGSSPRRSATSSPSTPAPPESDDFFGKLNQNSRRTTSCSCTTNFNHRANDSFRPPSGGSAFISRPPAASRCRHGQRHQATRLQRQRSRVPTFSRIAGCSSRACATSAAITGRTPSAPAAPDEIISLSFISASRFWNSNSRHSAATRQTLDHRLEWSERLSYFKARPGATTSRPASDLDRLSADSSSGRRRCTSSATCARDAVSPEFGMDTAIAEEHERAHPER